MKNWEKELFEILNQLKTTYPEDGETYLVTLPNVLKSFIASLLEEKNKDESKK